MNKDNVSTYDTSRDKLISGINKVFNVIKPTYGPLGSNVAIETDLYPGHGIYNDGKRITDSIFLEDPVEQMGANMLKEACDKQEKECGDGRKTTVILTTSILNEGAKTKDKSPLQIKRELDECLPKILESIDGQKREIPIEEIGKVAKIASESDDIAQMIGGIYPKIGREGIIEIETSNVPQTYHEIVDGIRLHGAKKILDLKPYQAVSIVEDATILIVRDKIVSKGQIEAIYKKLKGKVSELVLYCDEIEQNVLGILAKTNIARLNGEDVISTLVIKSPVMFKDWLYEDLERMTDATAIDTSKGISFNDFDEKFLGKCKVWKAEQDESRLNGTLDISGHVKSLENSVTHEKKDEYKVRLNWLSTKVAILKVGANSESELSWKIKKAIDASNACRLALKDGVVNGGGNCLASVEIENPIMKEILGKPKEIIGSQDLEGVIDPAIVVKSAITTAISLAGIILTIGGALVIPDHIKEMARRMQQRIQ